jgi:hypothetical protein
MVTSNYLVICPNDNTIAGNHILSMKLPKLGDVDLVSDPKIEFWDSPIRQVDLKYLTSYTIERLLPMNADNRILICYSHEASKVSYISFLIWNLKKNIEDRSF